MALEISNRIWKSGTKGSDKLMLLALADFADVDGICWPAYETLGKMCGVTKRQAIKTVDKLVNKGHLLKFENIGRGNTNIFLVKVGLSEADINEIVLRRLNKKGELHDTFYDNKKVVSEVGKGVIRDTINEAEKVNSSAEKVNSSALKGELQDTRTIIEPSKEPSSTLPKGKARRKTKPKKPKEPIPEPIKVYHSEAHRYPAKTIWPDITDAVDSTPDELERWRVVVHEYIKCGWNKLNIKGMLHFFTEHRIPTTQPVHKNGAHKNAAHKQNQASQNDVDAAIQRAKQDALRGHPI